MVQGWALFPRVLQVSNSSSYHKNNVPGEHLLHLLDGHFFAGLPVDSFQHRSIGAVAQLLGQRVAIHHSKRTSCPPPHTGSSSPAGGGLAFAQNDGQGEADWAVSSGAGNPLPFTNKKAILLSITPTRLILLYCCTCITGPYHSPESVKEYSTHGVCLCTCVGVGAALWWSWCVSCSCVALDKSRR